MNDSLFSRIGRIISGSANSLVDSVENAAPELTMKQAIREVEHATGEVRHELGKLEAEKYLTSKQLVNENEEHEKLDLQIQTALQEKRDDLAEIAVARQMDIEAQIPILEKTLEDQRDKIKDLTQYISALQAKKREMEQALLEYQKVQTVAPNESVTINSSQNTPAQQVDQAESAFNRVLNNNGGQGIRQSTDDDKKLAELEELSRSNRIQERLQQLKATSQA